MMRGRIRGSGKLARPEAAETFSDVARRRRAGIADLIAVFEITRGWSDRGECKHLALQFVGKLPAHEISKVAHPCDPHRHAACQHSTAKSSSTLERESKHPAAKSR